MIFGLGKLTITLINMIAHGHGNERYAQYDYDLWPNDPNSIVGSLLHLFQTWKKLQFVNQKSCLSTFCKNTFRAHLLQGKPCCIYELKTPSQTIGPKPLSKNLLLQMNNCVKDNKNRYLLTFLSSLTTREVFEEVKLGFLVVDHTHEDIDKCFGYLSKKMRKQNNYILGFDEDFHGFA
jgi:hypothetical protein